MGIWSSIVKAVKSMGSRIGGAVSSAGAAASTGVVAAFKTFGGHLNKFWIGLAAGICGLIGLNVADGQDAGTVLLTWLFTTTEGLCIVAILVLLLWMLFFRKGGKK